VENRKPADRWAAGELFGVSAVSVSLAIRRFQERREKDGGLKKIKASCLM
jgi:hypothetical protein